MGSIDLQPINSTASLSDNVELKNYYENLLFKNGSGKSLTDLPRKLNGAAKNDGAETTPLRSVDFISGFERRGSSSAAGDTHNVFSNFPSSLNQGDYSSKLGSTPRRQSIFNTAPIQENVESSYVSQNPSAQPMAMSPPLGFGSASLFAAERRSSYISDALIHGNNEGPTSPNTSVTSFSPPAYTGMFNPLYTGNNSTGYLQQPANPYSTVRGNTTTTAPTNNNNNSQYGYLNYVSGGGAVSLSPPQQQQQQQRNLSLPAAQQEHSFANNGLRVLPGNKVSSSKELRELYRDSGNNYFSSQQVYSFVDGVNGVLSGTAKRTDPLTKRMTNFLNFLKSSNLNYNPQSDAFISKKNRRSSVPCTSSSNNANTSAYLHYKPLALVSLKNGKLELLSTAQNSNMQMCRGDLVIIDGDRGKDLALVVDPSINLNLALMVNFLKKKIHFDSLITNRRQHYPNEKFIKALMDSTNGIADELNPKLYDVIELLQLVIPSKQVLRFATPFEVSSNLHSKFQDELKALHIAQLKLKSLNSGLMQHDPLLGGSKLNIKILNAEFQFDRKKLTFYYICEERNDFRELIKELFKFYKTRIWLCAIPNNLDVDGKYYDNQQLELKMYQDMMAHYVTDDLNDMNLQQQQYQQEHGGQIGGFIVAPPLNKLKLDNFQLGVYKELVTKLFS
ncbi:uncharacterized protein KNAG_0C00610 [Huiozyma naganishii CBS 8797]|uniref:PSP1 C-terminal domain-containing protein n=1 Tax=Huiozyma naganishii (strain ATCC MYA-139 / BCRC 22969 / CBS 8797 / KCTC 17520 / NBRC 10181 / NCYC 3082 / Yp74L-3) TaxID=1071383 RepID=J7R2X1_HUIN7|nr:hypothetical protein KNAG_0C00610 [Kazachstania naganishii CBS 8797]CCK69175.1 hypothetical protein KNAG_0C00610 [Kazachstania naganishii CBS 8797]